MKSELPLLAWTPQAVVFDCDGLLVDTESSWTVAETGVKPSGAMIFTPGAPAAMSLTTLPPFSQISPPTKTPCAPEALILTASAS